MLAALALKTRREWILLIAIIGLVAIAPLGSEATNPIMLGSYRSLLFIITLLSAFEIWERRDFEVCPRFLGLCALTLGLMWISLMVNPGSRFSGLYFWYQNLLFGAGFIAMAALHRTRNIAWKMFVLYSVIAIDLTYVTVDLIIGKRPLTAPFVNPNYFASFLLAGFACCVAVLLFERDWFKRVGCVACAAYLYFAMTQAWSRGATVAAIAILAFGILRYGSSRGLPKAITIVILALSLAGGLAISPQLLRKFADRGQSDPYNYQRPQIWLGALRLIKDHPVLGVGMGEFFHISKRYAPAVDGTIARYLKRPAIAHSEYLQYTAENGIPAALLLFTLAGYLVYLALRRSRALEREPRILQEAAILCATAFAIHALVDNNWDVPVMAAGLTVFSLGDMLPMRPWPVHVSWPRRLKLALTFGLIVLFMESTAIPAAGLYLNEIGHRAFMAGNLARAESMHRLAIAVVANHEVLLDNTGMVYFDSYMRTHNRAMLELADVFFTRAIQANPNAEDPRQHLEEVLIQRLTGNVRADRPIHLQIIELDSATLQIDPFNPFIRKNLAEALYNAGMPDQAERQLEQAIAFEPNYVPGYLRIADWEMAQGRVKESDDNRQKAAVIIIHYRNVATAEPYEALLLGRPTPAPEALR